MKKLLLSAAGLGLAAIPPATAQDTDRSTWKDVEIDFPKPIFFSAPLSIERSNLDKATKPRLKLKAPEGVKNIALHKTVSSSDPEPATGSLRMICDGDKDGVDASCVELRSGKQWVQIDLEEETTLYGVVVWHFHKKPRAYDDVICQISNDPRFEKGVTTVFNNDHNNSSKVCAEAGEDLAWLETNHGRILDIDAKKARYVRLWSNGNTTNEMNHYVEIEVYGKK